MNQNKKARIIKWTLIFFLLFGAFVDLYATVSDRNFIVLEGNFLYTYFGGIWALIVFKLLVCFALVGILLNMNKFTKNHLSKFFYVNLFVILIFIQVFAGLNNIAIKHQVKDYINDQTGSNYTTPSEVPEELIVKHVVLPKEQSAKMYIQQMGSRLYFPWFIGLLSFWLWENMFLLREKNGKDRENNQNNK